MTEPQSRATTAPEGEQLCTCGFGSTHFTELHNQHYCVICGGLVLPDMDTSAEITRGKTILVVDDDRFFRTLVADTLGEDGINEVLGAPDGFEAVRLLGESLRGGRDIDLVILDLRLPELDGIAVLRLIRALAPNLPVVLLTVDPPRKELISQLRQYGANRYVRKSADQLDALLKRNLHELTTN